MRDYPLITYVLFAAIVAWLIVSSTRRNFRKGTNRRKADADIKIWLIVGVVLLVVILAK